jgi:hypothetical protein
VIDHPLLPWEKLPATWRADEGESLPSGVYPQPVGIQLPSTLSNIRIFNSLNQNINEISNGGAFQRFSSISNQVDLNLFLQFLFYTFHLPKRIFDFQL